MEEALKEVNNAIKSAITRSTEPGDEYVPSGFRSDQIVPSALKPVPDDINRFHENYECVQQDFEGLQEHLIKRTRIPTEVEERLGGLLRWVRREFKTWTLEADKDYIILGRVFAATAFCSQYGDFWSKYAAANVPNPELVGALCLRISKMQTTLSPGRFSRSPISDKQILDRFAEDDRTANWEAVVPEWLQLNGLHLQDAFRAQSVSYLRAFSPVELAGAVEQLHQTPAVMSVLTCLAVPDALNIGIASGNQYVQVGSILRVLQEQSSPRATIDSAEVEMVARLLAECAKNDDLWARLMPALNRYPVRYPRLQKPLGKALAKVPKALLADYVNAISLGMGGTGRGPVAECLRVFRSEASLEQRKKLWEISHERWLSWNFGANDQTVSGMRVTDSELDYAIVGYALECLTAEQLVARCTEINTEFLKLDEQWHVSHTEFLATAGRILSTLQPYSYASRISAIEDWLLTDGTRMLPFDPGKDRYAAMYFGLDFLMPGIVVPDS